MTAPEQAAPECSGCRWYEPSNRVWPDGCANAHVPQAMLFTARGQTGACGPTAKYYEPKEKPE